MSVILALYEGDTIGSARLVVCTCDPTTVENAVRVLLEQREFQDVPISPGLTAANRGKRIALRSLARCNRTVRRHRKARKEGDA